ncbi:hypothetical protein LOD99_10438 [Oopsacas minuta]|uniref:Uncharacterized protein n=1 Tax=Oopsacas minuta TaxID=111878 RepID=A0AAV7KH88_9METZ|nr:hypothetical protein LOD99_10438 [Oopsacas minuta]
MLCSLITLISILTTFLKKRYYVHSIRTSLIRYAVCWCIEVIVLLACCTVYTLPLLFILAPSLAFINWVYFVYESKQLVYILKARIRDIVNYEWDRMHYKESRHSYKMYVVFSIIYSFALLNMIIVLALDLARLFIRLVLLDECYFQVVYKYKFDLQLSQNSIQKVSYWTHKFELYILPFISYFSFSTVLFPFIAIVVWNTMTECIKNRTTPIRYTPVYGGSNRDYGRLRLKAHRREPLFSF